jgi:hypothetical protein
VIGFRSGRPESHLSHPELPTPRQFEPDDAESPGSLGRGRASNGKQYSELPAMTVHEVHGHASQHKERGGLGFAALAWILGIPGLIVLLLLFL